MRAALISAFVLAGCGLDPSGLGGPSSEAPDGDLPGLVDSDVDPGGDAGASDATVPASGPDALPTGAISYFRSAACPAGWAPYEPARGRFVVATIGASTTGALTGAPLASGEDRTHVHGFSLSFELKSHSFVTASGAGNGGVARASSVAVSGSTGPASTGLPYVQLLVCKKTAAPAPRPLPAGLQAFFESATCPAGWTQTEESQGRFVVGLPKGAPADQTFGGAPLSGAPRAHAHGADAVLTTSPHGLTVFSGCCADGFARNGAYTASFVTEPSAVDLPTIELLSCTKS